ncbi:unnamed protein product [Cuscuta campestris]|uniref:Transmembrane protein n=1 Tax=Cuscuta campestris TaxID=132261 RepID=A0A484N9P6_9ASTE|nr:unnamed protein product [Cuscuta campestris]
MASPYSIFFYALVLLPSTVTAEERSPHGVANAVPIAISPEAYAFFHPDTQRSHNSTTAREGLCSNNRSESECSPVPAASYVQSSLDHGSRSVNSGGRYMVGAGAWVLIGLAFAALLALSGVLFVMVKRVHSLNKDNDAAMVKAKEKPEV